MAAGRPVIAFAGGGALDTIVDGVTGVLFGEQTAGAVAEAIRRFEALDAAGAFDPATIRQHALRFDSAVFQRQLAAFVENALRSSTHRLPVTGQ